MTPARTLAPTPKSEQYRPNRAGTPGGKDFVRIMRYSLDLTTGMAYLGHMMLSTAIVAKMNPVLTDRAEYLHHYAYALNLWAHKAEQAGHHALAVSQRQRAYYLRTLAR